MPRYHILNLLSSKSVAWLAVLLVFAVGAVASTGWALDIAVLRSFLSQWVPMSPVTAACMVLSAFGAAFLLLNDPPTAGKSLVVRASGALICLVGLITVGVYAVALFGGREQKLDTVLYLTMFWAPVARPALLAALLFLIFGSVLVLMAGGGRRGTDIAHVLAMPGVMLSYLVPVSYVLGVQALHQLWDIPVALNTGIGFCALFVAVLCARPDSRLMSTLAGDRAGSAMARRLLPATLSFPLLIGWAHLYGERSGTVLSESGGALMVIALTFCLLSLMWMTAAWLNRADDRIKTRALELEREVAVRKSTEEALKQAHDHLSERVAERTAELVLVNAHLENEMRGREKIQRETDLTNRVLRLVMDVRGRSCFLDELVSLLKDWIGCSCAGIRIVDSNGFAPYESYKGFDAEFLQKENLLSLAGDACACTRVVLGKPEPYDMPCMSEGGSFVLNNSTKFLETLSAEEVKRFRGICIESGYKSIAIIPIRDLSELIGAVHLTDEREGIFPPPLVCTLERLSGLIGEGIHKFKTQETLVANMTKLEALNRDLQEFAFIASHDLREPLRKIRAFGGMLGKDQGEKLDEKGRDYLNRMIGASDRMSELIEALTRYSRVTTRANPIASTDLSKVAEEVASDLELIIKRKQVKLEIGDLPTVKADRPQMRQLFQNLIENAIKYQPEGNRPVIRLHGLTENNLCRIYVEDNGIGFEQEQAERIFKPFERLHGRGGPYRGTGMGLAICRKIVERHSGTITAQSTPGAGSTFIVTLPASAREGA